MTTIVYKQSKMSNVSDKINTQANKNATVSASNNKLTKHRTPRRVISSRMLPSHIDGSKSCPAGVLDIDRISKTLPIARPKKTTKSDSIIKKSNKDLDFCKKCGDAVSKTNNSKSNTKSTSSSGKLSDTSRTKSIITNERPTHVDQYYRNENFRRSSESIQDVENGFKKMSLDTIKELPERRSSEASKLKTDKSEIFDEYPIEDIGFVDTEDMGSVKTLKEFRDKNYFECHSAKSRIENKISAISLKDHKCTYRFYLNDRLFPVPVSTDHQDNIRCVECHLPLNLRNSDDATQANGFIQAKIRLGQGAPQDTVMFLPVKDQLIIKERKKDEKKEEEAYYFGVIKLDKNGNSIFNQNLPSNSFALKYQKGYKEYHQNEKYRLESVDSNVIVI